MKTRLVLLAFCLASLGGACSSPSSPSSPAQPKKSLPLVSSFTSNPSTIRYGDLSTLTWSVSNASSVSIDQGIGTVTATGSKEVRPPADITYTLTATNNDGQTTAQTAITVSAHAIFEIVSYAKKRTPYGTCYIEGIVQNTGNCPGYKVTVTFTAYDFNNVIIDSAICFPNTLKTILPSTAAPFTATFYKITKWTQVKDVSCIIRWEDGIGVLKHISAPLPPSP